MSTIVPTVPTGGSSRGAWVSDVFDALVYALDARGIDPALAMPVARWITCLWWLESGEGSAEWNYNAANIACSGTPDAPDVLGWHGDCDRVGRGTERSYASRRDAIADFLDLMASARYLGSFVYLLEHPDDGAGWYARLQASGYSSRSQANIDLLVRLASSFARVRGG